MLGTCVPKAWGIDLAKNRVEPCFEQKVQNTPGPVKILGGCDPKMQSYEQKSAF